MQIIRFNIDNSPYAAFSNFAPYSVDLDGRHWPTVEHYYQAQKFSDSGLVEQIRNAPTPGRAKRMGRGTKPRPDWEAIRDDVMYRAVKVKFEQHDRLRELLVSTDDLELVEHSPHDSYWGDGGNGSGKNMLGRILMRVRDEIRASEHSN